LERHRELLSVSLAKSGTTYQTTLSGGGLTGTTAVGASIAGTTAAGATSTVAAGGAVELTVGLGAFGVAFLAAVAML